MAQKLILCEATVGSDLLQGHPLAEHIANGYEVTSVSGYTTRDNRHMALVLLSEPASRNTEDDTEPSEETTPAEETTPTTDGEP